MSVRLKRPAMHTPPPELLVFDAGRWAPADVAAADPRRPTRAWEAWRAARAAWVDAGGVWPGGENQREMQEAIAGPDEPFDAEELLVFHSRRVTSTDLAEIRSSVQFGVRASRP